ncbi:MAG: DNA gyrase/topoisomerase IV subunit A, partial [Luteibaculum sp.]
EVLSAIDVGLQPHIKHLLREVTQDDIVRLTEIKIKRISKFDSFKADEAINKLEDAIAEVKNHLDHLIDFAIDYYQNIKKKYGKGKERKTELRQFDTIEATRVVVSNRKLYVDREEGFVGHGLKKAEFVDDCSDIDDVIVFRANGTMMVSKVQDKAFFGKDIIHVGIWKKGDDRTIYNMVYQDGKTGPSLMKRFAVTSITRDKEYDLTAGTAGSKVLYFTANPNGEAEILNVLLRPRPHLKKLRLEVNLGELAVKGRGSKGNILTKHLISKISQKESLGSTLDAREIWWDESVKRLNDQERGKSLGKFRGRDKILVVYKAGYYKLYEPSLETHFDEGILFLEKYDPEKVATVVYYDGKREKTYIKRFELEENDRENTVISEEDNSEMLLFSFDREPKITMHFDKRSGAKTESEEVLAHEFIAVKGMKALGNQLSAYKIKSLEVEDTYQEPEEEEEIESTSGQEEEGDLSLF